MTDTYVYEFTGPHGSQGTEAFSRKRATLEMSKGIGKPLMESRTIIDHTELDGSGFLAAISGNGSGEMNDLNAQIGYFNIRATSRDHEALKLNDHDEGKGKCMLSLENRVPRVQARKLNQQLTDLMSSELDQSKRRA